MCNQRMPKRLRCLPASLPCCAPICPLGVGKAAAAAAPAAAAAAARREGNFYLSNVCMHFVSSFQAQLAACLAHKQVLALDGPDREPTNAGAAAHAPNTLRAAHTQEGSLVSNKQPIREAAAQYAAPARALRDATLVHRYRANRKKGSATAFLVECCSCQGGRPTARDVAV